MSIQSANSPHVINVPVWPSIWGIMKIAALFIYKLWWLFSLLIGMAILKFWLNSIGKNKKS
jgi:hypothetical protein